MKKLITIILLLSVIACSGQEKKISELPEITTVAASAEFPLSQGGTTYKATKANLQKEIADSLANHLLRIVALEENDSTWAQIRVDSIWNATPGVGVTIEGVKIEDYVVNIPAGTGKFEFGDGSSYITLPVDDVLHFFIGDETRWSLSTTNFNLTVPITPSPDKAVDFGGVGDFFRDAYFNRWYVANTSTFIDTLGTKLRLSDGSGTYLLEELAAGTSYSAGSGLTLTSTTFSLGGALSGQSLITGTGAANDILLRHINTGNYSQHLAIEGDSAIELIVFEDDDFTGYESGLFVSEGIVTLQARASISPQKIMLTADEMLVTDGANSRGLLYDDDYSGQYTNRSLVDKEYVDDAIIGSDTVLILFGGGGANPGDTAAFTTSTIYSSFKNNYGRSLRVISIDGILQGTTPSIDVDILWNTTFSSGSATHLNTVPPTFTSTSTGDSDTSFDNDLIPPGNRVWCKTPTITTKPTYMEVTMTAILE